MNFEIFVEPLTGKFCVGIIFEKKVKEHKDFTKQIAQINTIIKDIKENVDGVYYDGEIEYKENFQESNWIRYKFRCYNEIYLNFIKNNKITFKNKYKLEEIMAKAPYQLWSVTALKNECKQRNFPEEDYQDVEDKSILGELLKQDDNSAEETKTSGKDKDKDKSTGKSRSKPAQPKSKSEDNEKKVSDKKEKLQGQPKSLNEKLKDAGLWIKGCQFLSNAEKETLLGAKNQKERNSVYKILENKKEKILSTLSEKMKNRNEANAVENNVSTKAVSDEDELEEDVNPIAKDIYADMSLAKLRKEAIKRKDELKKKGIKALKKDSQQQLVDKLRQADYGN